MSDVFTFLDKVHLVILSCFELTVAWLYIILPVGRTGRKAGSGQPMDRIVENLQEQLENSPTELIS